MRAGSNVFPPPPRSSWRALRVAPPPLLVRERAVSGCSSARRSAAPRARTACLLREMWCVCAWGFADAAVLPPHCRTGGSPTEDKTCPLCGAPSVCAVWSGAAPWLRVWGWDPYLLLSLTWGGFGRGWGWVEVRWMSLPTAVLAVYEKLLHNPTGRPTTHSLPLVSLPPPTRRRHGGRLLPANPPSTLAMRVLPRLSVWLTWRRPV